MAQRENRKMPSSTAHAAGRVNAQDEIIEAGGSWSGIVRSGEVVTIADLHGRQGVDFLCYCAESPEERYHAANTIKKARTLRLTTGHVLYSDTARR
jgi:uncharacterized protein YcgI (DUF1989 family)